MPLTRYQIRNEYSLADPELYRAADKDDPEALLEGVAMAGLVGVLRQLGDLAEFAAEIFHDLHEEVMATATRGHGLTIRVQQLEAEFPPIEKAILSQTSHTSLLHNSGFDWHPNLQMDQNLITRGDLPRFIMDSYEECRGPPRLFLLDKFDIAGAGACLKRYSDPSFFKAESTTLKSAKSEDKREKRSRKTRRKVLRAKNGETPEGTQTFHSKLHDLFLEERSKTEDGHVHKHHMKLKRRQSNCSLVDSTTRKSYMERILDGYSPNGGVLSENSAISLHSKMDCDYSGELVPDIHEIGTRSPANNLMQIDKSQVPSSTRQEKEQEMFLDELGDDIIKEGISEELPKSIRDMELEYALSNIFEEEDQKELVVDVGSKNEASADGYRSDDVTSEIDNYMDALTTMESEMETDTESRPRNEWAFNIENKRMDSNIFEEHKEMQAEFSDSQSMGSSKASDDGNNSINLPENVLSDGDAEAKVHPSTDIFPGGVECTSAENIPEILHVSETRSSERVVSNSSCNEVPEMPHDVSKFEEKARNSCKPEPISAPSDGPGACSSDVHSLEPDSDEISSDVLKSFSAVSSSNIEKNGKIASNELPCRVNVSDLPSQSRDDLLSVSSHGEKPKESLKDGKSDVSYEAESHVGSILDLSHGIVDTNDDTCEEFLSKHDVVDGSLEDPNHVTESGSMENLLEEKLYMPESVVLPSDHCLSEQDSEACSDARSLPEDMTDSSIKSDWDNTSPSAVVVKTENAVQSDTNSEWLTSVLDCSETSNFPEKKKYVKMSDEVLQLQSNLEGICLANAGIEVLDNKLASNTSDCVISDRSLPDSNKNNAIYPDLLYRCPVSDSGEAELAAECPSRLTNLVTESRQAAVDDEDNIIDHGLIDLSSKDQRDLQEQCVSDIDGLDHDKLETTEISNLNDSERTNEQNVAEDQTAVVSLDDDHKPSYLESDQMIDDVHDQLQVEDIHEHLQFSGVSQVSSSSVYRNQESELKESLSAGTEGCDPMSSHLIPEREIPLPQGVEMTSDQSVDMSLHEVGESPESSEQNELPKLSDGFTSSLSKSSQGGSLSLTPNPNLLPQPNNYNFESSEPSMNILHSVSHNFGLPNEGANCQPLDSKSLRPVIDLLPIDHCNQHSKVQETPPLPPLPPLQWRMGKLQHGSQPPGGMLLLNSFNPFSAPLTAKGDAIAQQGLPQFNGEFMQHPNPFLPLPTSDDTKAKSMSQAFAREKMWPSPVPAFENEKIQLDHASEPSTIQHQYLLLPQVNNEPQHVCSELDGEILQPSSSDARIAPLPIEEEQQQPQTMSTLAPILQREDEKLGHTSQTSGDVQLPMSSATVEQENSQHVSLSSQGEFALKPDIPAELPALEDGKPNGSLKTKLPRPRDPLIEAVASHNKSNLRKVAERVRPEIKPKADERGSLLEQIRTKSFNLKPATLTRPSIQGPKTNLKVVAILEKANAIRQALAGSDEDDDEDSWSDS